MSADERQRVDLVMPSGMQPDAEWLHHPATLVLKAEMAALTEQLRAAEGAREFHGRTAEQWAEEAHNEWHRAEQAEQRLAEAHAALADLRSRLAGLGTYYRDITAIMALLTQPPTPGGPRASSPTGSEPS